MWESEDITKDREIFAKDLKNALYRRLPNVQKDETLVILEIFDTQTLVKLQLGKVPAGKIHYDIPKGTKKIMASANASSSYLLLRR